MKSIRHWSYAVVVSLAVAGCGEGDPVALDMDLVGNYDLVSITYEGQPTGSPPFVTGALTLTETTYAVEVNAVSPEGPVQIIDEGSYTFVGDTWTQDSSMEQPSVVGTYEFDGELLRFDVTAEEQNVLSTWRKTS